MEQFLSNLPPVDVNPNGVITAQAVPPAAADKPDEQAAQQSSRLPQSLSSSVMSVLLQMQDNGVM
jgi:hypothetical protein